MCIFFELLNQEPLMRIVTGQAVGRQDDHGIELAAAGGVTQSVQGRAMRLGSTDPIIHGFTHWQKRPIVALNVLLERAPLTLDRACLWLLTGRGSRIQGSWHPCPPGVPEYS